jgi:hypothetical protein
MINNADGTLMQTLVDDTTDGVLTQTMVDVDDADNDYKASSPPPIPSPLH